MTGWMRLELFRMPSGMGFLPFTSKHLKCGHKIRPNQVSSRDFGTSGEGEVWYPDIFRSEKRRFRALGSKNYSIGGNHPRAKRNRVSTISLVQVDEKFTKFQFFKQLCPSWDLPCDSVHEPNDFSCSCSGLERNPLEKKNTGIAFSTAASPSVWWWKLPAETQILEVDGVKIHPRMGFPIRDRSFVIQGKKHWKSIATHKSVQESLDKRWRYHPRSQLIFQVLHGMNVPYHNDNNM